MRRKKIPLEQQLAAALACLLPQAQRDELRHARVPAKAVIRLFSPDHIWLHSLGGPDAWWNIDPKLRPVHAEKSRGDTAIAAKVKRLRVASGMPRQPRGTVQGAFSMPAAVKPRPKRKIAQRRTPWPPRGSRPLQGRPWG